MTSIILTKKNGKMWKTKTGEIMISANRSHIFDIRFLETNCICTTNLFFRHYNSFTDNHYRTHFRNLTKVIKPPLCDDEFVNFD